MALAETHAETRLQRIYRGMPMLRPDPLSPDPLDGQRLTWSRKFWHSQDEALRRRDRQIEENVRMLLGQQWTIWNPWLQKFIDVTQWMTDDERRWRQRPVINRLLYWYMLTHARLTENPPIVTFQPSTADRFDAMLAEVADVIGKTLWREVGMIEVLDDLFAWLIPSGTAYLLTRVDAQGGPLMPWRVPATLQLLGPDGAPVIERELPDVPFDRDGNPLAELTAGGEVVTNGEPHVEAEGALAVDVLSALQVRGEWGPRPWHRKTWHTHRAYLTPEEVWEKWGVECPPDVNPTDDAGSNGELARLLFGAGYHGAAEGRHFGGDFQGVGRNEFVTVDSHWIRPSEFPGMEQTPDQPGGRLTVTTQAKVLFDGPRPARFRYTSPLRQFIFVRVPGRPGGTTPQEMQNPLQRTYNRGWAQILEHRNLVTNPKGLIDQQSGIDENDVTNRPGENLVVNKRQGVPAFEYVAPPTLSEDVYKTQQLLLREMLDLGQVEGAEGRPPTRDPSGELIKELRFNSDRFLAPTARRSVEEIARMMEDWFVLLPTIWDREKVIAYAGEDNVVRTILVYPELFERGKVNVIPDVESMLPEGRGERQQRIAWMYGNGLLGGPPGTPEAVRRFYELSKFPHMGRANQPGGIHRITAQRENGQLLQGVPALEIPIFPWYDPIIHLEVVEEFMASPDYLTIPPEVQQQFLVHWQGHMNQLAQMQAQAAVQQGQLAAASGQAPGGAPGSSPPQPERGGAPRSAAPGAGQPGTVAAAS